MTPGQEIKALRAALGLTREVASRILGVSHATLQRWEHDLKTPTKCERRGALEILREQQMPVKG